MNIVMFGQKRLSREGGVEIVVKELCTRMVKLGNRVNAYTSDMDFHGGSKLSKLTYPIKTIYSTQKIVILVSMQH